MHPKMWTRSRLLVLGTTYPRYSRKYREVACTGALREDTKEIVRLHPVPKRYLDEGKRFKAWQWITVDAAPHSEDPRSESIRIHPDSIELGPVIKDPEERRNYVERSPGIADSIESMTAERPKGKLPKRSLAIVRPKAINLDKIYLKRRPESERAEWEAIERELLAQGAMFGQMKPIAFPEMGFHVPWRCDDNRCNGHDMRLNNWGLNELYRKLKFARDANLNGKVIDLMRRELDTARYDIFFFVGTSRTHLTNFMLLDSLKVPKVGQMTMFGL
ncbi:MAG: hypothetical protein Q8R92_20955 [Deltaproteobacteria bacterium]|nr:hypothetical protein [Deltaproteobacteria bacterium]